MLLPRRPKKNGGRGLVLAAAALQDHISRSYSLSHPLPPKAAPVATCSRCGRFPSNERGRSLPSLNNSLPTRQSRKPKSRHVVDCWMDARGRTTEDTDNFSWQKDEREHNLDRRPPALTLAQRLGLAPVMQQQLLSENDWDSVKGQSKARGDSDMPCAICREGFGLKEQVILSCSHVFHRACLHAFERHSGKKCCPLCRREQYQTRVIYEGAKQHRIAAAIKIQSAWRGYVVRSWYTKLRETVPPSNPQLRKKYYEHKLSGISDRLLTMSSSDEASVTALCSSVDQSIAQCKSIMRQFELRQLSDLSEEHWQQVMRKAEELQASTCAICLGPLRLLPWQLNMADKESKRPTALLSCAHVFHLTCIESLEEFTLSSCSRCPICRSVYCRRPL